ncbi:hypothetical protein [Streptomyces sp. H27-H5]|uniref:hypothetical protein n=1 Tax=Streptomyces sp. H27-H5 TaxID=2996460 RepID=UPI0022714BD6|nr:hypothetical protein [Streptomyces sp. H27-H5]MCY0957678.1 hypothetical protein [Streptomyces sp. H27-H5]
MTRPALCLTALYITAFGWVTYLAARALDHNTPGQALALYAAALLLLAAAGREILHNARAQATAMRDRRPRPHTFPSDTEAIMRAELDSMCDCHLWWTTLGNFHTWACLTAGPVHDHEES